MENSGVHYNLQAHDGDTWRGVGRPNMDSLETATKAFEEYVEYYPECRLLETNWSYKVEVIRGPE